VSQDTIAEIKARLAGLEPQRIDIIDESARHAGHAGAKGGGGHYRLTVVSATFSGLGRLERHRLVYQALGDLMQGRVHALSITALAAGEL